MSVCTETAWLYLHVNQLRDRSLLHVDLYKMAVCMFTWFNSFDAVCVSVCVPVFVARWIVQQVSLHVHHYQVIKMNPLRAVYMKN